MRDNFKIFNEMIEALNHAQGAAGQLIHRCGHPVEFMVIREALELTTEGCMKLSPINSLLIKKELI